MDLDTMNYEYDIQKKECFIPVPLCFQETEFTCGVACVQSILACYGINYRQTELTEILDTKPYVGTDYLNIIHFMQKLGFEATFFENETIKDLKKSIVTGITPMLLIQAWAEKNTDYNYDWRDAHYVIACGFKDNYFFIMDPYTLGYFTYISATDLIQRWHFVDKEGKRHYYSGLIVKNEFIPYNYNPDSIKHLA